jgi:hypothetical protein
LAIAAGGATAPQLVNARVASDFGLRAEVLEYPGGMPGDIGFILTW